MAAQKRTGAGSSLSAFYIVLAVVVVAGLGALAYSVYGGRSEAATAPVELEGVEDARKLYEMATPQVLGDPTAPVKIVEFGDYQCPGCAQFATQVKPVLKARYVDTGKVQFVFYDYPLTEIHAHSFLAARASRCAADQGKYWEFQDLLFSRQSAWAFSRSAPVGVFAGYARELGLDGAAFEECLGSDAHADVVTANRLLGERLGVHATPTIIINNRRIQNANNLDLISGIIDESLQGIGS